MDQQIDTMNKFQVIVIGGNLVSLFRLPPRLTKAQARNLAAWLAVMSDELDEPFEVVYQAVLNRRRTHGLCPIETPVQSRLTALERVAAVAKDTVRECEGACEASDCEAWKSRGLRCTTCPKDWSDSLRDALATVPGTDRRG